MKANTRLVGLGWRIGLMLVVAWACGLNSGCATRSTSQLKRAPFDRPPVKSAGEVLHQQQVTTRARELLNTGKYKTSNEAKVAALKEVGGYNDPAYAKWSADQARWQQQVAEQEKFQKEFAKLERGF